MLRELREGTLGVRFDVSSTWTVRRDEPRNAELFDEVERLTWLLSFGVGHHLDVGPFDDDADNAGVRARLEAYARQMFNVVFAQLHHDDPAPQTGSAASPRTADPSWSPLIDVEHEAVGGVPALRTVHRMAYEPGREVVMGHLLVPLKDGLFEARVLGSGGRRRTVYRCFVVDGALWSTSIAADDAVAADDRGAELDAVVRGFRPLPRVEKSSLLKRLFTRS